MPEVGGFQQLSGLRLEAFVGAHLLATLAEMFVMGPASRIFLNSGRLESYGR